MAVGMWVLADLVLVAGCGPTLAEIRGKPSQQRTADLLPLLDHPLSWVREEAALVLGQAALPAAVPKLQQMVVSETERPLVRAAAARSLGQLRATSSLAVLEGLVGVPGTPPEVKLAVIDALCAYAPARPALQAIALFETDEDLLVSITATQRVKFQCAP